MYIKKTLNSPQYQTVRGRQLSIFNSFSGFTVIELIIVMVIIGVLGGIVVLNFPAATARARDTERKSDLYQFRTALETFANSNEGFYPAAIDDPLAVACTAMGVANCPEDPKNGENECAGNLCEYNYQSNSDGTSFVLYGSLESPSYGTNWNECLSGQSGESVDVPVDGECPDIVVAPASTPVLPTSTPVPPTPTPAPVYKIFTNARTNSNCASYCIGRGAVGCESVGRNFSADNGLYLDSNNSNRLCKTRGGATCNTVMKGKPNCRMGLSQPYKYSNQSTDCKCIMP